MLFVQCIFFCLNVHLYMYQRIESTTTIHTTTIHTAAIHTTAIHTTAIHTTTIHTTTHTTIHTTTIHTTTNNANAHTQPTFSCLGPTVWRDVRPLQGFWRVPWNTSLFKRCPYVNDCRGYDIALRPDNQTAPDLDGCVAGTEGLLCSQCSPGFNRGE